MAKKARKKAGKKTSKKVAKKVKKKAVKAAPARRKKSARKPAKKAKPPTIVDRLSNAYHTVVDTVTGTDTLRNRMEKPGTSETQ
jgi:hypothetical protein